MGAVAMSYIGITNIIGAIIGVVLAVIIKPGESSGDKGHYCECGWLSTQAY